MKKAIRIIIRIVVIAIILLILAVLGILLRYGQNFGIYLKKPTVQEYVENAVSVIDSQAIYADTDEWAQKKAQTLEKAKSAESYEDTYEMINEALKVAGGKHSRLIIPDQLNEESGALIQRAMPEIEWLVGEIIVIKLPEFSGDADEGQKYADIVINEMKEKACEVKGAIIDLRGNTGGDMGPMVAAVSPFLDNGEILYFDYHGMKKPVTLSNEMVSGGGSTIAIKDRVGVKGIPVAILQDDMTASSGEATLLAFRGLDCVKTFGAPTAGYCSCNNVVKLYDGAQMLVTIGKDVARTGEEFCEDPIVPDVETDNPKEDAIQWITEQMR